MDDPLSRQYLLGGCCVALGTLGWVLPYRWNPLRLGRLVSNLLPPSANLLVPKILGSVLILSGGLIVIGTATVGRFE